MDIFTRSTYSVVRYGDRIYVFEIAIHTDEQGNILDPNIVNADGIEHIDPNEVEKYEIYQQIIESIEILDEADMSVFVQMDSFD